jgi:hypothetical protein
MRPRLDAISHTVLLECDASPHRFHPTGAAHLGTIALASIVCTTSPR